jgi:hypothetical protein
MWGPSLLDWEGPDAGDELRDGAGWPRPYIFTDLGETTWCGLRSTQG